MALLASLVIGGSGRRILPLKILHWFTVAGVTFSALLVYVQFAVLHAYCLLCLASAAISAGLAFSLARALRFAPAETAPAGRVFAVALAVFAVLGIGTLLVSQQSIASPLPRLPATSQAIPLDLSLAEKSGPANASVQLVVFSDYTCEYCRQFAPVMNRIREQHANDVLLAYRPFPKDFHGAGYRAALAAQAASEQEAFWRYHEHLFEEKLPLTDERLIAIAQELGLDVPRFRESLSSEETIRQVDNSAENALRSGVLGTPSVFLNGVLIGGVVDYPTLEQKIQALLKPADQPSK